MCSILWSALAIACLSSIVQSGVPRDRTSFINQPDYLLNDLHHFEDRGLISPYQSNKNEVHQEGEPLNELDFINGNKLNLDEEERTLYSNEVDPLAKAGLFEGDIQNVANISELVLNGRNAILDMDLRWPNGKVPYVISSEYNSAERSVIARAMSTYHSNTCIRFVPRTSSDVDHIFIIKGRGCSSSVGRQGGRQQVSLGNGCLYHGIAVHELMHAVGFWHEQSRADRDQYITIIWSNIIKGMEYNFQKYSWQYIQNLGEKYDLGSVMHYDAYAFAAHRGQPTIMSKDKSRSSSMGQRHGFSSTDTDKINKLYECSRKTTGTKKSGNKLVGSKPDNCIDSDPQCAQWGEDGECDLNPIWMKANCLHSCGICDSSCMDHNKKCKLWAKDSECEKNAIYMLQFCKKSCKVC